MLSKQEVLSLLEDMSTEENRAVISQYVNMVNSLDDKRLQQILEENGIKTKDDINEFIKIKTTRDLHKFQGVNELISFGTNGNTLHIHVVPTSLRDMLSPNGIRKAEVQLIDALEKIKAMLATDEKYKNINNVYAVSNLITRPITSIFERLGFDVKAMLTEQAKEDSELSNFYERFKNGEKLGRAKIAKEKIMTEEWSELVVARKEELEKKLGNKFLESLESQVNTEVGEEEIKIAEDKHIKEQKDVTVEEIE